MTIATDVKKPKVKPASPFVPEKTPEKTPEESPLSGGEQTNGKVPG